MFFNLFRRNGKKSYKENGIYFASLIISIVAFYVVLSLEKQDVMVFLKQMESDAVKHLLSLISGVYGLSLFIIFFLIFFAAKYQLERRNHEFGVLLMLGMKKSRLFFWLMAEDFYSSTLALAIGLPVAIGLSEIISLVTAKVIGLGIIGHQFSLSWKGICLTTIGFIGIKMVANIVLSSMLVKKEPGLLIQESQEEKKKVVEEKRSHIFLIFGGLLLAAAYTLAILGVTWENIKTFVFTVALGVLGTFLLIKGFCAVFSRITKKTNQKDNLQLFTFRQLQENVFLQSTSITISSLLVLMAIACMGYGISVSLVNMENGNGHSMDFTLETYDEESEKMLKDMMEQEEMKAYIAGWTKVQTSLLPTKEVWGEEEGVTTYEYDTSEIMKVVETLSEKEKEQFSDTLVGYEVEYKEAPYMISLSGINALLKAKGEKLISLKEDQLAFYIDPEFANVSDEKLYEKIIKQNPHIKIGDVSYEIYPEICSQDIVVDRCITISFGIIVADEMFYKYAQPNNISTYWNAYLKQSLVEEKGLMQAIMQADNVFKSSGMEYENYLQNMGRQLFYIVAASYLTIYLAIIFLIIANTVISLQFLMQEKKTKERYHTLICLGSTYEAISVSSKRQIKWYFGLPLAVAAVSSLFGVCSLLSGILPGSLAQEKGILFLIAGAIIVLLCVIEYIYVKMVMRMSDLNIMQMMTVKREE